MAYGSSELDIAASTYDTWINEGNNAVDLMSAHNQLVAVLWERSEETGDSFNFKRSGVAEGGKFKLTHYGNQNTTVDGVTRANQVTAFTPTVPGAGGQASILTNAYYEWTHYQGICFFNVEDLKKNQGKAAVIDFASAIKQQMIHSFYVEMGDDLWDGNVGAIDKLQSVTQCLKNTGTVGGIDQSSSDNLYWQAQTDSTAEVFNFFTFDTLRDACVHDTGVSTGITGEPDCSFMPGQLYAKARQDLKVSQRVEVSNTLKGGAKYLEYDGCRLFRETKMTAGECVILNSATWAFRYDTAAPEPTTEGFIQDPLRPSIKIRQANWFVGLGCISPKHNAWMSNKRGS